MNQKNKNCRIVFMGTPEFSVPALKNLHEKFNVVAVYSQPDRPIGRGLKLKETPVKAEALKLGIPVFQPEKLTLPGEYEKCAALQPDLIVVVAYGQILKKNILTLPKYGCVNIHSSLLPRWRGAAPIHHALLSGDEETGVTTMKMVEGLDAGDMYHVEKVKIGERETVSELHDRLSEIGGSLIVKTVEALIEGTMIGIPQDSSKVTIASKLTKEMEKIDFTKTCEELDRQVRALNPWPGVSHYYDVGNGKLERLKIIKAEPLIGMKSKIGELSTVSGMCVLGCSNGSLKLVTVQPEGKKEMPISDFINGCRGRGIVL